MNLKKNVYGFGWLFDLPQLIIELLNNKDISTRWENIYGKDPTQQDVDKMFKDFVPMQLDCLDEYSEILPNTKEAIDILRDDYNIKIGSTTGFTRVMVNVLEKNVNTQITESASDLG